LGIVEFILGVSGSELSPGAFSSLGVILVGVVGMYVTFMPYKRSRTIFYQLLSIVIFGIYSLFILLAFLVVLFRTDIEQYGVEIEEPDSTEVVITFIFGSVSCISLMAAWVSAIRMHISVQGNEQT
jgi:hypothetical protein